MRIYIVQSYENLYFAVIWEFIFCNYILFTLFLLAIRCTAIHVLVYSILYQFMVWELILVTQSYLPSYHDPLPLPRYRPSSRQHNKPHMCRTLFPMTFQSPCVSVLGHLTAGACRKPRPQKKSLSVQFIGSQKFGCDLLDPPITNSWYFPEHT